MATQCEAPLDCTDPDCVGSPINFQLWATLSVGCSIKGKKLLNFLPLI